MELEGFKLWSTGGVVDYLHGAFPESSLVREGGVVGESSAGAGTAHGVVARADRGNR